MTAVRVTFTLTLDAKAIESYPAKSKEADYFNNYKKLYELTSTALSGLLPILSTNTGMINSLEINEPLKFLLANVIYDHAIYACELYLSGDYLPELTNKQLEKYFDTAASLYTTTKDKTTTEIMKQHCLEKFNSKNKKPAAEEKAKTEADTSVKPFKNPKEIFYTERELQDQVALNVPLNPQQLQWVSIAPEHYHLIVALVAKHQHPSPAIQSVVTNLFEQMNKLQTADKYQLLFHANMPGITPACAAATYAKNGGLQFIFNEFKRYNIPAATITAFANDANKKAGSESYGSTPLHFAAWSGSVDGIQLLCDHGANVFAELPKERGDGAGWMPIDFTIEGLKSLKRSTHFELCLQMLVRKMAATRTLEDIKLALRRSSQGREKHILAADLWKRIDLLVDRAVVGEFKEEEIALAHAKTKLTALLTSAKEASGKIAETDISQCQSALRAALAYAKKEKWQQPANGSLSIPMASFSSPSLGSSSSSSLPSGSLQANPVALATPKSV